MKKLVEKYNKFQNIIKFLKILFVSYFGLTSILLIAGYIYCLFTWTTITCICTGVLLIAIYIDEKIRSIKTENQLREYDMQIRKDE